MEKLFLELFNRSITAGWLILAVILLRLLFRRVPKWVTGILWLLIAVRLVNPFSVESVYSLIPTAELFPQEILYSDKPSVDTGAAVLDIVVNHSLESSVPGPGDSVNPLQIVAALSSYIWLAGMTAMLLFGGISYLLLKRKVRTAVRLRENIRQSEFITVPFVLGMIRPTVYLPFSVEESDAEYIIAHEKAHIRRGDHLVKPAAFLLLAVYWFHPLMWLAYILLCRDIELACDERVIRNMSADERKAYSNVLLGCTAKQRLITVCPVSFGEVGVKTRVKSVLNYRKPAFWGIVLAFAACVVCAVCLLTDPQPIEGLPLAEEIAGVTMKHSISGLSVELDTERIPQFMEALRTATKTYRSSYNDTPDTVSLDNNTYLEVTISATGSPSFQKYYLYSRKGKAYLMRPYDAEYRFDEDFYSAWTTFYHSALRDAVDESLEDYLKETIFFKAELEGQLEQAYTENKALQTRLEQKQSELIATRGEALGYARELEKLKASGSSADYFNGIFAGIRESIRYEAEDDMISFMFPDVPESAQLDIVLTGTDVSGKTETVLRCDGSDDFSAEPGGKYSVTIAEGTTAVTMHVTAESTDGPCEVTFDLMDWVE